jgi:adenylyltransferase/sulfurtransferase
LSRQVVNEGFRRKIHRDFSVLQVFEAYDMTQSPRSGRPEPGHDPSDYEGFDREELLRYARHFVLPNVGPKGQKALSRARVLLVGAGGLGSPIALYLAGAGVGKLGVVDGDLVDLSNLQRQVLHGTDGLGQAKVDSARERLWGLNPNVEVVTYRTRFTAENAGDILADYDLVVDGSDNFPTRYLINDACVLHGKPYVYGAVDRWEGQVSVFGVPGGPCYRCLFREPPPPGLVPTCAEAGVMGVLPGIIGSLQAAETIKLILGVGTSLVGRVLIFDGLHMTFREVGLRRSAGCPLCGDDPSIEELVDYERFCGVDLTDDQSAMEPLRQITPLDLKARLQDSPAPFLLDVREPYEWEIGNLGGEGAAHIPQGDLLERLDELPPEGPIVVYCRLGVRSALVARTLMNRGFRDVYNLRGGYHGWADQVDRDLPRY